jgi:hypothetical protein
MSQQLARDSFYGPIMASIQMVIVKIDKRAEESGLAFTDSQVNAVLHRVAKTVQGKPPKAKAATSTKETLQATMAEDLIALRPTIHMTNKKSGEQTTLEPRMYAMAILAVKDALQKHRDGAVGVRDFLTHAHEYVRRLQAQQAKSEESSNSDQS